MNKIKVNMAVEPNDIQTLHCSQYDTEERKFSVDLHENGVGVSPSSISNQLVYKSFIGGTEQILPTNTSTPSTSPIIADIQYKDGLREDEEFLYRESPSSVDGYAKIKEIRGNTLVWNQLVENGDFASTSNWSNYRCNTSASSNIISLEITTAGSDYPCIYKNNFPVKEGNKYIISVDCKGNSGNIFAVSTIYKNSSYQVSATGNWQRICYVYTSTNENQLRLAVKGESCSVGQTIQFKNCYICDLTKMGLDTLTASEFTSLFPLSYYAYDSGSLLSFGSTPITFTQMVQNGDYASVSNWQTLGGATYTVSNNVATVSSTNNSNSNPARISQNIDFDNTHYYYVRATVRNNSPSSAVMYIGGQRITWNPNTQFETRSNVFKPNNTASLASGVRLTQTYTGTYSYDIKNFIVVDLTETFGSGKEPTQIDCDVMFEDDYYSYGSHSNYKRKVGIKTVGKNAFDCNLARTSTPKATVTTENGKIRIQYTGATDRYVGFDIFKTYFVHANEYFLKKKYTLSFDVTGVDTDWVCGNRTVSTNSFSSGIGNITVAQNGHYSVVLPYDTITEDVYLSFCRVGNLTSNFDLTFSNIQIELGTTETAFEPYKESVLNYPILDYFPTGLKSAGSIYDQLDETGYITRVGIRVLDGTENWGKETFQSWSNTYYVLMGNKTYNNWDQNRIYCKCNRFEATPYYYYESGHTTRKAGQVFITGQGTYAEFTSNFSSVDDWKADLQQNPITLYYELITPLENYGVVDMGNLEWTLQDGTYHIFSAVITDMKAYADWTDNTSFVSKMYFPTTNGIATAPNMSIRQSMDNTSAIYVKNTSYSDANAFKSAMSGVYLLYELNEPKGITSASIVTNYGEMPLYNDNGELKADCIADVSQTSGFQIAKVKLKDENGEIYSNPFQIHTERSPI